MKQRVGGRHLLRGSLGSIVLFFEDDAAVDSNHELFGTMDELNKPISSYYKFIIVDTWSIPKLSFLNNSYFFWLPSWPLQTLDTLVQLATCSIQNNCSFAHHCVWKTFHSFDCPLGHFNTHHPLTVYKNGSFLHQLILVFCHLPIAQKILLSKPPQIWSCSVFSYRYFNHPSWVFSKFSHVLTTSIFQLPI